MTDMIYEIMIETTTDEETIRTIAREAESMCYAHNTLKKVVRMNRVDVEREARGLLIVQSAAAGI